ncbi:MAG: hypothetical protein V3V31_04860 [Methylococcales bacterium]
MQLITLNDGEKNDTWGPSMDFDPAFQVRASEEIRLTTQKSRELTLSYLAFQIARSPADLINHTRRIVLEYEAGNEERLYGALQDLFIALDGRGQELQKSLLEKAKTNLNPEHHDVLRGCLNKDAETSASLPYCTFSVLNHGVVGTQVLVEKISDTPLSETIDPVEEAQTCIVYSQVDEARLILEKAILKEPGRIEIHKDLLEIYQSTRDCKNFESMRHQLSMLENPFPNPWKEVEIALFARLA